MVLFAMIKLALGEFDLIRLGPSMLSSDSFLFLTEVRIVLLKCDEYPSSILLLEFEIVRPNSSCVEPGEVGLSCLA